MSFPYFKTALSIILFLSGTAFDLLASVREIATVTTSAGTMEFELYTDVSPRTVANFKYLADSRFYDGTAFHRLIPGFMIQGGCPNTRNDSGRARAGTYGQGGPEYTIPDEPTDNPNRTHVRGVLSMAKTSQPNSGGSQFFIMFGGASNLDNKHAPMGRLIRGEETLSALEKQAVHLSAGETPELSVPDERLVVTSIRIRSEITGETPRYQAGAAGGLLRNTDRVTMGKYNIALTSAGNFTGRFDYWGRPCSFTGKLPLLSSAQLEKEAVVLVSGKGTPLRVRVRVRQSASLKNSVSVTVCAVNNDGTDVADSTLVGATGEIGASSLASLAPRYTARFAAPMTNTGSLAVSELRGAGFLTLSVTPSTGLCAFSGQLPDGRVLSSSHQVSNEGGRLSLSLHCHELIPLTAAQVTEVAGLTLANLPNVNYLFRLVGVLELPDKNGILPQGPSISSYFFWQRAAQTTGAVRNQISAFLLPTIAPWKAPKSGTVMLPFATGVSSKISMEGSADASFTVPKTVATTLTNAAFATPSPGSTLLLNPVDGTFSGFLWDSSAGATPIKTAIKGVLIQGVGTQKGSGAGFALTKSASLPVSIAP